MKTYFHYLGFRLKKALGIIKAYLKEDAKSFLCWVWIFTSVGGVYGSIIFMGINQDLGLKLMLIFFMELAAPILYWSRGWVFIAVVVWLAHIPQNIFYWFQDQIENYRKWKEESPD